MTMTQASRYVSRDWKRREEGGGGEFQGMGALQFPPSFSPG